MKHKISIQILSTLLFILSGIVSANAQSSVKAVAEDSAVENQNAAIKNGRKWLPNHFASRYLVGPSAINLRKGEGYYQNTCVMINSISQGITDYITVSAGVDLSQVLFKSWEKIPPMHFVALKYGGRISENWHMASGVLVMRKIDFAEIGNLGLLYVVGTHGDRDNNLSIGTAFGMTRSGITPLPMLSLSAMARLGNHVILITENSFRPDNFAYSYNFYQYQGLYSMGVRFFGKRMAVDLAMVTSRGIVDWFTVGLPYVDFSIRW